MATLPLIFSDIAGSEILLILVFVLVFFGSKSIPGIAQSLGRTIRQIKDASNDVQNEIKKSAGDIRTDFNLQRMMDETKEDIEKPFREHARTLDQSINFDPPKPFVQPMGRPVQESSLPLDQQDLEEVDQPSDSVHSEGKEQA
jgi:sec-independent protein translocase protein TatA